MCMLIYKGMKLMKIGFISDLHIDRNGIDLDEAVETIVSVSKGKGIDNLFLGGDTSADYRDTLRLVEAIRDRGIQTYTIFGNNEYKNVEYDYVRKIEDDSYIHGREIYVGEDTVIIAIDGYHDFSFATLVDNIYTKDLPKDFETLRSIVNKSGRHKIRSVAEDSFIFSDMYDTLITMLERITHNKKIIVLTHYVPSPEFIVYTGNRSWDAENAYMGSTALQEIAEEYGVSKVVFGHTHSTHNEVINGVSYHCNPVGYVGTDFENNFTNRVKNSMKVLEV